MDLPDNGLHVDVHTDPSNDLVGLTFGTVVEVLVNFFKDIVFFFRFF